MAAPIPVRRVVTCVVAAGAGAALAMGHGSFVKPLFNVETQITGAWANAKSNASTRGTATTESTQLYFMDDPRNHTGIRQAIGWRVIVQDEEISTSEDIELSWVRYAPNGVNPDEGPTGIISKFKLPVFGWPRTGQYSYDLFVSNQAGPVDLPANSGMGIRLPAAPSWPNDGASVHAQLNLPNDPLRPRVPPPYDQEVWTFERAGLALKATPLGGRTLDTLEAATVWWLDPVLKTFTMSTAYGGAPEKLFGPESIHPVASRGDQLGFVLEGGNDGAFGMAFFMVSPTITTKPWLFPGVSGNNQVYLGFDVAPFPVILDQGVPNPMHGRLETTPIDFNKFPPGFRNFWVQALIVYPSPWLLRITDAVGVQGL